MLWCFTGTAPGPNGGPPITIDNNISTQNGADNSNSGNVIAADDSDDDDFPLDIVIGAGGGLLALLLVICAVCFFCCRRRKPKQLPPPVATQHPAPVVCSFSLPEMCTGCTSFVILFPRCTGVCQTNLVHDSVVYIMTMHVLFDE